MKTLVVVSALVTLAIAAPSVPTLSGDSLDTTDLSQDLHLQAPSLPDVLKRDKKSPSEITTSSDLNSGVSNSEVQNVPIDGGSSTPMERSFGLKKSLIVKKKNGYRVFRDSEEEKANAESNETCGRQVKVKLCEEDGKSRSAVKGSLHESSDIHMSDDDVKHSLKMAKEAVENLQRDLKKIELKSDMRKAHESQSDTALHEDIEVARQALKHVHENFGNLESMSLHATKTRDSETMHDVHLTIAKTEEGRMAQWKEAMENIQKNVEIARNIEDSFKVASNQENLFRLDQSEAASEVTDMKIKENSHLRAPLTEANMRLTPNAVLETLPKEKEAGEEKVHGKNEHLSEHNAREEQNTEEDMKTSPSEMIEVHLDNPKNREALRSENHKIHEQGKNAEAKLDKTETYTENKDLVNKENIVDHHHNEERSSELNTDILPDQSEHHITMHKPLLKAVEEGTENTSENISDVPHISANRIHPLISSAPLNEHQKSAEQKESDEKIESLQKPEKNADDMIDFLAKSAVHLDKNKLNKEQDVHKQHESAKAAEISKPKHEEHLAENWDMKPKEAVQTQLTENKHLDNIPKSAEQSEQTHIHKFAQHNDNIMLPKSADHASLQNHQKQHMIQHEELSHFETAPAMKAAEEHLHHLQHMHNAHWAHENRHLDHLSSIKAADDLGKEFGMPHGHAVIAEHTMDHLRYSHLPEHSQIPSKMGVSHDFEVASHVQPHPSRHHHNQMLHHSQLHEMSGMGGAMQPNFHPSLRDAMEGFGSDHMFRWKPAHESARSAYGTGLSSSIGSSGAVGVFPNANTGGCAIPLLLSCSPSVVSGSLAKAHSSYSAPAYRSEDDFSFHNKRDITKSNDIRTSNALRSPSIVKQNSQIALENKI